MKAEIGCRFCLAERFRQVYGVRLDPQKAQAFIDVVAAPAGRHPRSLDLTALRDPLTQQMVHSGIIEKTRFFRDLFQTEMIKRVLQNTLDRKWAAKNGKPRINIWSVGCSTGQEPYSVAALIRRMGWQEQADFRILGTDISAHNLALASLGKGYIVDDIERPLYYPGDREIPDEYRRFFREQKDQVDVRPEVKQMVTFRLANILDPKDYQGIENVDLVLVNNVFYYFEAASTRQALDLILPRLSPQGAMISKDLSESWITESGLPLTRLFFDDALEVRVNGQDIMIENHRDYAAFQKSA